MSESAPAGEVSLAISPPSLALGVLVTTEMEKYWKEIIIIKISCSMISLCMMDNPGEWAVSQEFFSTAEASGCGRTCIRCSPQR